MQCNSPAGSSRLAPKFKEATLPVFKELYKKVKSGEECVRVLKSTGAANYKEMLDAELKELGNSEMWRAGAAVRKLRPVK